METKNKMTVLILSIAVIAVLVISYVGIYKVVVPYMTQNYIEEQVENALEKKNDRIKELNKRIAALSKQLDASKKRYDSLRVLIQQKVDEASHIKVPETRDETIDRFRNLGYNPEL